MVWLGQLSDPILAAPAPVKLQPERTLVVKYIGNDNAAYAADLLQKWLRKVYRTSTGFQIVAGNKLPANAVQDNFIIALGPSPWSPYRPEAETGPYGFSIRRTGNVVSIVGPAPKPGTSPLQLNDLMLGATYFLDKYCGVRVYLPHDLFGSVPANASVTVPAEINVLQKPFTSYVSATGFANLDVQSANGEKVYYDFQWARHHGFVRRDWESHQHSMGYRFPPEKFAAKYPEIYPVFDGKRYIPQGGGDQQWQPDFAEPHLVDAAVESAVAYFKEKPNLDYISFSVQDSWRFSKEGKMGEALRKYAAGEELTGYTDLFVQFINQVAARLEKELPRQGITGRKTLVYLAYSGVASVPREKLHPNVLPVAVFRVAELDLEGSLQTAGGRNPSSMFDWMARTKRIGIHDWAQGNGYFFPRIYSVQYARLLRFIRDQGGTLEFAHLECYPNWGLDGPKYYLMGKLLWDPDTDVNAELTQFSNDLFGRASREMYGYFNTLEQLSYSMNNNPAQYRKLFSFPQQFLLIAPELALVQKARGHLDKAARQARTPEEKQRIALFSKTFRLSEYLFEVANAKEIKRARLAEITRYVDEVLLKDPLTLYLVRKPADLKAQVQYAVDRCVAGKKIVD
ncbi:MAG: DUF4838 domain-containing protein [Cytophagales bacterium]|nr:DUF4838 domain-containing protein [Cytophagales bacterium]